MYARNAPSDPASVRYVSAPVVRGVNASRCHSPRERSDRQHEHAAEKHLHRGRGHDVVLLVPLRERRARGPSRTGDLKRHDTAGKLRRVRTTGAQVWPHEQYDAREADDEASERASAEPIATKDSLARHHPERRRRDDDRSESARHELLSPDDEAVAESDHQQAQ